MKFLSYFDSFLMYKDIHTKSQNFLKISMFSNKIFTLTSRAQLFEKVKISHKISIFLPVKPEKLTVFNKNWCWEKHSLLYSKVLQNMILSLYLKMTLLWPKTNTFCIKWYFLLKRNNATWNVNFTRKMTLFPKYHRIKSYFESK